MHAIFLLALTCVSIFMILLVLIQRGKGGGLAGAFGGMGGQSAFGTKAGDTFTKITVVTAILWFGLCIFALTNLRDGEGGLSVGEGRPTATSSGSMSDQGVESGVPMTVPDAPSTPSAASTDQ